jgi:hypothetical protein
MHSGEHLHLSLRIAIDAVRLRRLKCVLFITRNVVRLGREKLLRRGTCRSRSPVSRKQNRDICIFGTHTAHIKHRVQNNCEPEELAGVQHYFSWEMTLRANVPLKSPAQIGTPGKGYLPETVRLNASDRCRPGPNWLPLGAAPNPTPVVKRVVVAGCYTKGAGLAAHRSNSGCCAAHIRSSRPDLRPNGVAASPLRAAKFREAAILSFKPDPWPRSVTGVIENTRKASDLDSSFAPGSQDV